MQNKSYIVDAVNDLFKYFSTVFFQTVLVSLTVLLLILYLFFFQEIKKKEELLKQLFHWLPQK